MPFFSPFFALVLCIVAILAVRITFIWAPAKSEAGRFGTIDGLRGYLAFFVFLHHAAIWYGYCHTGVWIVPDSHLYTHLGQSSVALFFMITSFLFYDKLLSSGSRGFDWHGFFVGRFFRLTPLYIAVVLMVFVIVAILSNFVLVDTPQQLLVSAIQWLTFTVSGAPNINQIDTPRIVASVIWSLPYEWCFYFALPLLALSTRQRPPLLLLALSAAVLVGAWLYGMDMHLGLIFIGGMVAAVLVRVPQLHALAATRAASVVVLLCLGASLLYPTPYRLIPLALLTIVFCLIALGTNVFGLLSLRTSQRLGELAYSIYLLHGVLLYCVVNFLMGKNAVGALSSVGYWTLIAILIPVLLGLSAFTFHYIEQPGIDLGKKFRKRWARSHGTANVRQPAVDKTLS